jgi:ABC-2 type transport system permease protein
VTDEAESSAARLAARSERGGYGNPSGGPHLGGWTGTAIYQLTVTRMREAVREPGTLFWVFGFPIVLSVGLGLAFRNRPPDPVFVGVLESPGAPAIDGALRAAGLHVERLAPSAAGPRLRAGKIAVLVIPPGANGPAAPITYRFDPARPAARAARDAANGALQAAAGRVDPRAVKDDLVTAPGTRYIDFLIPGLIGMNIMSGSMWGIGWVIVNTRVRKLLKRMMATPVRRRDFLLAQCLARLLSLPLEVAAIAIFARLAFGVTVAGSLVALAVVSVVGALAFAALALLVSSRAENTQTASGLMNLVMMPMFVLSGVFFSATHFPNLMQPLISALPLTALNDALRAVMIDGASLVGAARPLAILAVWGIASFVAGLRIFRWS